jgi:hypothetical protein
MVWWSIGSREGTKWSQSMILFPRVRSLIIAESPMMEILFLHKLAHSSFHYGIGHRVTCMCWATWTFWELRCSGDRIATRPDDFRPQSGNIYMRTGGASSRRSWAPAPLPSMICHYILYCFFFFLYKILLLWSYVWIGISLAVDNKQKMIEEPTSYCCYLHHNISMKVYINNIICIVSSFLALITVHWFFF